jgi:hypothetical protein
MTNFYQNIETKEVISKSKLTSLENWREKYKTEYIEYSELHPILIGLPTEKIKLEYSSPREQTEFIVVPLEIVLNNITDRSIWEGCPELVNMEIYGCIKKIIERGDYPYNSSVAAEFCKSYNCKGGENDFLSSIVYTTQNYDQIIEGEIAAKNLHKEMTKQGFYKMNKDLLLNAAGSKRKFLVYLTGTNVFGTEVKKQSDSYMTLKSDNNNGYLWMKPRASRKGFRATLGQYIKEIGANPEPKIQAGQVQMFN